MKICFICDLHLPFCKDAMQYNAMEWTIDDIREKKPDCIVYAGDITCDGNIDVYRYYIERMKGLGIPFLYIPGNSDLRCDKTLEEIKTLASECKNTVNGTVIYAVNDSDKTVLPDQLDILESADCNSIVFMHHPIFALRDESRKKMEWWRDNHKNTMLFYAHMHKHAVNGNSVSLQAIDPDKAIGESPCITYFDTVTKEMTKSYFSCPVPKDLHNYFGISCMDTISHIEFAIENNLRNIELRPGLLDMDRGILIDTINRWRNAGGENLSVHLPDIAYIDGEVVFDERIDEYIAFLNEVKADRVTQHVPVVMVKTVRGNKDVLKTIAAAYAERLNRVNHNIIIGVENMHMTAKDTPDCNRRFGYIPEECIEFMECLGRVCRHRVGINLDIGHARNNAPYSQRYQTSTWLTMVGEYIVGYHIHQVTYTDGVFENHMGIEDVYGKLISYASLFRYWSEGRTNKAPFVFEMRPEDAYEITLNTFNRLR